MSLPWVRLDSQFPSNPKVLALVSDKAYQALVVYVGGLAYAGAHGTDGFIPRSALPFIHGRTRDAETLVRVGLWNECAGGWDVQSWADYQPSVEEFQKRRDRAKRAAAKRWSDHVAKGNADA